MNTTMQRALRYISNLSLMEYCRLGRKFQKYYKGIIPIAGTEEIVNRMYLNIEFDCFGYNWFIQTHTKGGINERKPGATRWWSLHALRR